MTSCQNAFFDEDSSKCDEDAFTQLSFSISVAASSVFIARENSYEDKLDQRFAKCSVWSPRAPQEKLRCSANQE